MGSWGFCRLRAVTTSPDTKDRMRADRRRRKALLKEKRARSGQGEDS